MEDILSYLSELSVNNNREWFEANRLRYEACRKRFIEFSEEYLRGLVLTDSQLTGLKPKDCIWRIYRDVRFSKDKRPYKDWFGVFPAAAAPGKPNTGGKKSMRGGYYIHIQPGNCMFAGGIWNPSTDLLKALRQEVYANYEEVEEIMSSKSWKRYFDDFDTQWMLKKGPAGFPQDFVHIDWLKRKSFTFSTRLTDKQVCDKDFVSLALDIAKAAKPMNDFLNYTFEEYGEFKPNER
ncbi:MAG: DUF2461 domain-containing protein [Paludibacteraceae bacterium]|nr:DUF2461 domain-containing protein [Paludibacteraceae bacterium]